MEIARQFRDPATPVGIVKDAYRKGEATIVTTLGDVAEHEGDVDMHSTVIVGGTETRIGKVGGNERTIITPRGYQRKYVY